MDSLLVLLFPVPSALTSAAKDRMPAPVLSAALLITVRAAPALRSMSPARAAAVLTLPTLMTLALAEILPRPPAVFGMVPRDSVSPGSVARRLVMAPAWLMSMVANRDAAGPF